MSQFWDTYTPECGDCKSYAREAAQKDKRIAELERQLVEAKEDTADLDWLEAHPASSEPLSYWEVTEQCWMWRWMGITFETLREAIRAARKEAK